MFKIFCILAWFLWVMLTCVCFEIIFFLYLFEEINFLLNIAFLADNYLLSGLERSFRESLAFRVADEEVMILPLCVSWHFYLIVFILCFVVLLHWLLYVVEKLFSGHIYLVMNGSSVWLSISFVGLGNSWLQFPWIDCLSPWALC